MSTNRGNWLRVVVTRIMERVDSKSIAVKENRGVSRQFSASTCPQFEGHVFPNSGPQVLLKVVKSKGHASQAHRYQTIKNGFTKPLALIVYHNRPHWQILLRWLGKRHPNFSIRPTARDTFPLAFKTVKPNKCPITCSAITTPISWNVMANSQASTPLRRF